MPEMNSTNNEGRKARLWGPVLFRWYGSTRSDFIRGKIRSLVLKLEGDEYYSLTIRQIFSKYHHREVGLYSAGASLLLEAFPSRPPGVTIGRYTSLTPSMRAFNADHPTDWKSTHAFFYNPALGFVKQDLLERTRLTIGNDVWIGHNAILLPSVSMIGDGAVIAAGSVVFQNVPPYAVVGGCPARLIRYRFSREAIEKLQASKWWEKSIDELKSEFADFQKPWEKAVAKAVLYEGARPGGVPGLEAAGTGLKP
jgi:acetyltransferase-like isoleucine patch superfamily enzyme